MKTYFGYNVTDEDFEFIRNMEGYVNSQCGFCISSDYYGVSIDPVADGIEVWHNGELISKFASIETFLLNYDFNGTKIISLISDFDFE